MRIKIVVDANVILAALLGGSALFILLKKEFEFVTTKTTLGEVEKYLPRVEEKSGVKTHELKEHLQLLPIEAYPRSYYQTKINAA